MESLKNHLAPEPELNHKDIHQEDMDFSTYILEGLPKNDKTCVSQNPFMGGFSSFGILLNIYFSAQKSKKITIVLFFLLMHVLVPSVHFLHLLHILHFCIFCLLHIKHILRIVHIWYMLHILHKNEQVLEIR